jgi:hypothetical protein
MRLSSGVAIIAVTAGLGLAGCGPSTEQGSDAKVNQAALVGALGERAFADAGQGRARNLLTGELVPRFEDCGDGTVADHSTGLLWEKKTGELGTAVFCDSKSLTATEPDRSCDDTHHVNNTYDWCRDLDKDGSCDRGGTPGDGAVFLDFLGRLNGTRGACLAGVCDWQLPTIGQLKTLVDCSHDGSPPCIDPVFGPTASSGYWSSTSGGYGPSGIRDVGWGKNFGNSGTFINAAGTSYARGVRSGACRVSRSR